MNLIKRIYRKLFISNQVQQENNIVKEWVEAGKPLPPPHLIKQLTISSCQQKYDYKLFIETGTFIGDMVEAQKHNFEQIYSIELSENLYIDAVTRFNEDSNVTLIQGDSGLVLPDLCNKLNQPVIFWLDGHYSGGITALGDKSCPIYEELTAIFNAKPYEHILLIDDARLFIGDDDYPTIPQLIDFIKKYRPLTKIVVEDDMIKAYLQ